MNLRFINKSLEALLIFVFVVIAVDAAIAFDYNFEGRFRSDARWIPDSPSGIKNYDAATEIRLGGYGNFVQKPAWSLDYEILVDNRNAYGAAEKAGFVKDWDADFFRAWVRLSSSSDDLELRAGRQQLLFGAGALFRPLGFYDNRVISGVFPQTVGVDSFRLTWHSTETTTFQSWLVPAKSESRMIVGGRWEALINELETGIAFQYHPVSKLRNLANFDKELTQFGYHIKGEFEVGFWNETRFDLESDSGKTLVRADSVFGTDYTFDVGQGLHILLEYFISSTEKGFSVADPKGDQTIHQFGLQMDQPLGIAAVWRMFAFYDVEDGSFQWAPQVEYALTDEIYLYLQGNLGGNVKEKNMLGRLFRESSAFTGTESSIGLSMIVFF
jgi:hypothetical protein